MPQSVRNAALVESIGALDSQAGISQYGRTLDWLSEAPVGVQTGKCLNSYGEFRDYFGVPWVIPILRIDCANVAILLNV